MAVSATGAGYTEWNGEGGLLPTSTECSDQGPRCTIAAPLCALPTRCALHSACRPRSRARTDPRYSDEFKYRPAASPVITEYLKDGRIRLRGATPGGVGVREGDLPLTPMQKAAKDAKARREAEEKALEQLKESKRKAKERARERRLKQKKKGARGGEP